MQLEHECKVLCKMMMLIVVVTVKHLSGIVQRLYYTNGDAPQNGICLFKNGVFILTCFNFSHLQNTLHLMQYTYQDIFSMAQNDFELVYVDAF